MDFLKYSTKTLYQRNKVPADRIGMMCPMPTILHNFCQFLENTKNLIFNVI